MHRSFGLTGLILLGSACGVAAPDDPRQEAPSDVATTGAGLVARLPAIDGWNYALIAHPEFSRDDGRVGVLSYTRPAGFLVQETRLVEVRFDERQ